MSIAGFVATVSFAMLAIAAHSDEPAATDAARNACDDLRRSAFYAKEHVWAPLQDFRLRESECQATRLYSQHRAQLESFVGNHGEALRFWDKNHFGFPENQGRQAAQPVTSQEITSENAISLIVRRSSDHQMVIVNERHHVSSDRLLTLALLEPLSRQGFRYLAVEAAWPGDDINQSGYPTKNTGYYINDVVYAELLRAALSLGYEIVWYEIEEHQKSLPDSRNEQARRDYWQARNLVERTQARDPGARVLVHCGWGHVSEQATPSFQPMAHFVHKIAGIDPLTVDQTWLGERSSARFEHPLRAEARHRELVGDDHLVLVDEAGELLKIGTGVDIRVLSPRTRYRDGRPTWMEMLGRRRAVTVAVPECSRASCVVEARNPQRPDEVAFDRVEVTDQDAVVLFLPNDANVELFLFGTDGQRVHRETDETESRSALD